MEPSRKEKSGKASLHMSKQRWKQRDINGAIWSDWHRTGPGGGELLVAYVPLRYLRHKQASIFAISLLYPFGEGCASSFDKLESSSSKSVLCQLWLKLVYCFWRRFSNFINVILLFYLPLEQKCDPFPPWNKSVTLYLKKRESHLNKDALCQVSLKLAQWFWRRSRKCEKYTDRQTTDNRRSEKLT